MGKYDIEAVKTWAWMMEDTASYTVGGGAAYTDSLDLLMATALEKGVDPYSLDAKTLACVNRAARRVIQDAQDIYETDDEFQREQELSEIADGAEALNG